MLSRIKNRSKEDAADQIMWTAEKTMNEMNNAWREGLLNKLINSTNIFRKN